MNSFSIKNAYPNSTLTFKDSTFNIKTDKSTTTISHNDKICLQRSNYNENENKKQDILSLHGVPIQNANGITCRIHLKNYVFHIKESKLDHIEHDS